MQATYDNTLYSINIVHSLVLHHVHWYIYISVPPTHFDYLARSVPLYLL
jgi:hypothetical protein